MSRPEVARDVTDEADSGGHTDNRPLDLATSPTSPHGAWPASADP
ncbi:hypothetical protein [Streptomyces scopuliridis]